MADLWRAQRYAEEIKAAVSAVLQSSDENVRLCAQEEQALSVPVLLRRLYAAERAKADLSRLVGEVEPAVSQVTKLKEELETVKAKRDAYCEKAKKLENESTDQQVEGSHRYDELQQLFSELSREFQSLLEKDAKQKSQVAEQLMEIELLKAKSKTLEDNLAKTKVTVAKLTEDYEARAKRLIEQHDIAVAELLDYKQKLADAEAQVEQERSAGEVIASQLRKECETLSEKNQQLLKAQAIDSIRTPVEYLSNEQQRRITALEHENAALLRTVERLQREEGKRVKNVENELRRWMDAVSILGHDGSIPPTPSIVARYLSECETVIRQKDQLLYENETQMQRLYVQLENEKTRRMYAEMRLEGEETAKGAAEVGVALLTGQLDVQKELLSALKREDESAILTAKAAIENSKSQVRLIEGPLAKLEEMSNKFQKSMGVWADATAEKDVKLLASQDNYYKLEKLLDDTTRSEKMLRAKLDDQKSFIQSLEQKLSDVASSVVFHEQIEKERQRAIKLLEISKRFYLKEAQTIRALVKAILGWSLFLERNGEDLAISLVPVIGKHTDEKDAPGEIVLLTKADEAKIGAENFTDADFNIHLTGSFADSWEAGGPWREALLTRQSIPVFLAAHVLEVAAGAVGRP